jgi:cell fate regulator YaaT (PSP1 superfamily)
MLRVSQEGRVNTQVRSSPAGVWFGEHNNANTYLNNNGQSIPSLVFEVHFKYTQEVYALGPDNTDELIIGDYVYVEAERGIDVGIIHRIVPQSSSRVNQSILGRIRALDHEKLALNRDHEESIVLVCRRLAEQKKLPIIVGGAEMQFDRQKLTIVFSADHMRVDFRDFVRHLYSIYRTRIWMQKAFQSEIECMMAMADGAEHQHHCQHQDQLASIAAVALRHTPDQTAHPHPPPPPHIREPRSCDSASAALPPHPFGQRSVRRSQPRRQKLKDKQGQGDG